MELLFDYSNTSHNKLTIVKFKKNVNHLLRSSFQKITCDDYKIKEREDIKQRICKLDLH